MISDKAYFSILPLFCLLSANLGGAIDCCSCFWYNKSVKFLNCLEQLQFIRVHS